MQEIKQILIKYWGYSQFRPKQESIIQSVLQGRDTLALLPQVVEKVFVIKFRVFIWVELHLLSLL